MRNFLFYTPGGSAALVYARERLISNGLMFAEKPSNAVTHLLLGVPAFNPDGTLKGGAPDLIFPLLSKDTVLVGGNLQAGDLPNYKKIDLLQDPLYLAHNADITAHCAVRLALWHLPVILKDQPILVVGWGRIGKCLSRLLRSMGACVSIAARQESDRAIISALGFQAEDPSCLDRKLPEYRIIFNTAPAPVLPQTVLAFCREDCLKIDLASTLGMDGQDVIVARGLPGKDAPESSGALIADTILRLIS